MTDFPCPQTLVTAAHIAPMTRPVLRDGGVLIADGHIAAIGIAAELAFDFPNAARIDLGPVTVLPGLVNPHTHLELSSHTIAGDRFTGTFVDWLRALRGDPTLDPAELARRIEAAVSTGTDQCLRFGVTTVGDISQQVQLTRPLLRAGPLRAVSFGEVLGLGGLRERFEQLVPGAIDPALASDRLIVGLSPHAPYTVDLPGYQRCFDLARDRNLLLATHLSEQFAERRFLMDHEGIFRELWDSINLWRDDVRTFRGSPIEMADALGFMQAGALLAHVNDCNDGELALLARGNASVVYCPRTHAYFGHPPHRWREMLARGINVSLGTDSCASSPDLNLLDDLRLARRSAADITADQLFSLITVNAAKALRLDHLCGSLHPGRPADLAIFQADSESPLDQILESDIPVLQTWIAGRCVYSGSGKSAPRP